MFRNVYYDRRNNNIHLWHTVKGKRLYDRINWVPHLYIPTKQETGINSIFGENVQRKDFNSFFEFKRFEDTQSNIFENNLKPEIQFLADQYYKIADDDLEIPEIHTGYLDIEVHSEDVFPDAEKVEKPIVVISVFDSFKKEPRTFGIHEYNQNKTHYTHCSDEKNLLERFYAYMFQRRFDVISGWYVVQFDLQYLYNRTKLLFGENNNLFSYLSPIKKTSIWNRKDGRGVNIDIAGVSILDYQEVYKKFSGHNLESYSLDFVSTFELEEGKLDYSEYPDLKTLYHKNWDKYVEYNVIDVVRVFELEDKLQYIKLITVLSLLTKCPMKYYDKVTSLIEGLFLTYYRRNNLCAPKFSGGHKQDYDAAYVKEPQIGMFFDVVDLDITSSYPHAMITMNMGNETFFGKIQYQTEKDIIFQTRKREFDSFMLLTTNGMTKIEGSKLKSFNLAVKRGLFCVSPNGVIFSTTKKGAISEVEKYVFQRRKKAKLEMLKAKKNKKAKNKVENLFTTQLAYKLLINSIYGALAVPYYRGFNIHIAEAITSIGRYSLQQGENFTNEIMNDISKSAELKKVLKEIENYG